MEVDTKKKQDARCENRKSRLQFDRIQTEEAGYRIEEIPRSLVALYQGAGGFSVHECHLLYIISPP